MYPSPADPAASRGGSADAGERAEARLARLLNTGPFDEALRAAVAVSGLSLDRIQDRLKRRGSRISVATLSSWQSGRYRPERPSSLLVLGELEEVLGVPQKSLSALIGPPRPRGRRLAPLTDNRGLAVLNDTPLADMAMALGQVDMQWDEALGRERGMYSRLLLRAEVDGPDRWISGFQRDDPGPPAKLRVEPPHRLGKVIENPQIGLVVAEILFDRPLKRGDIIILEYTHENRMPRPYSTIMQTALHVPVREYLREVRFDPTALPESCHSFRTAELDADASMQERLLKPDAIGSVMAVALSAGPCRLGIRWDWGATSPLTVGP
jgi:hypothetical protein